TDVVPLPNDRLVPTVVPKAEHPHAGWIAEEEPPGGRRQAEPARRDHPNDVAAGERQHVASDSVCVLSLATHSEHCPFRSASYKYQFAPSAPLPASDSRHAVTVFADVVLVLAQLVAHHHALTCACPRLLLRHPHTPCEWLPGPLWAAGAGSGVFPGSP